MIITSKFLHNYITTNNNLKSIIRLNNKSGGDGQKIHKTNKMQSKIIKSIVIQYNKISIMIIIIKSR
jgi:hypothetical protein